MHGDSLPYPLCRFPAGKYVLYFLFTPYDPTVTDKFSKLDQNENMTQSRLEWFDARSVFDCAHSRSRTLTVGEQEFTIYPFFADMIIVKGVSSAIFSVLEDDDDGTQKKDKSE